MVAYAMTTRTQVMDAIKELKNNGAKVLGTVFTMYDKKKDKEIGYGGGYYKYGYRYYRDTPDEEELAQNSAEEK
jgi:Mrp family chromosome partitioning ATPase